MQVERVACPRRVRRFGFGKGNSRGQGGAPQCQMRCETELVSPHSAVNFARILNKLSILAAEAAILPREHAAFNRELAGSSCECCNSSQEDLHSSLELHDSVWNAGVLKSKCACARLELAHEGTECVDAGPEL